MPPWRPLGGPWAPTLLPEPPRSRPGEALGGPGAPNKFVVGSRGASWGEKLVDFTLPEAPREGPRAAPGGHFGNIFAARPAGMKKVRNSTHVRYFWRLFLSAFLCFFFAFPAAPAQERTLKILVLAWKVFKISLVGHFLAERENNLNGISRRRFYGNHGP